MTLLVCEVLVMLWAMWVRDGDQEGTLLLLAFCTIFTALQLAVKRVVGAMGWCFSKTFRKGPQGTHALSDPDVYAKFIDQAWHLTMHVGFSAAGAYLLFHPQGEGYGWFDNTALCWQPIPAEQAFDGAIRLYYLFSMARWVSTAFMHRQEREGTKDFVSLFIHHLAALCLVGISATSGQHRIGTLILFAHDVSDIPLDLLKICNYLKLSGPRWLFMTEFVFVATLVNWAYFRLWLIPSRLMYSVAYEARQFGDGGLGMGPDGEWSWLRSVQATPWQVEHVPFWALSSTFLVVLTCLQAYWFVRLLRIALRLVGGEGATAAANAEYEDLPESSKPNTKTTKKKKKKKTAPKPKRCSVLRSLALLIAVGGVFITGSFALTDPIIRLQNKWAGDAAARAAALEGLAVDTIPLVSTKFSLGSVATDEQKAFLRYYGFIHFDRAISREEVAMVLRERGRLEREFVTNNVTNLFGVPLFKGACLDGRANACLHRIPFGSLHSQEIKALIHDARFHTVKAFIADANGAWTPADADSVRIGDLEKDGVVMNSYVQENASSTWSRPGLGWHTDGVRDVFYLRMPRPMLNVGLHLDTVDPAVDAALCLLPGTHTQGLMGMLFGMIHMSHHDHRDEVCVATNAGDLTVHDGRLWHRVQSSTKVPSTRRSVYVPYFTADQPVEVKGKESSTPFYHYLGMLQRRLQGGQ